MQKHIVVDDLMDDIIHITNQIAGLNMLLKEKKKQMSTYFTKSGKRSLSNDEATVYRQERTNIEYDVDAICNTLPKDIYKQFIEYNYSIRDWNAFTAFVKKLGITAAKLRPFITVKRTVNQAKLSKLYERGIITLADLEGCYTATVTTSVSLRMKNIDKSIDLT